MTIRELIEALESYDPDLRVYVDWDCEGGNEGEVDRIEDFKDFDEKGIALRC